MKRGDRDEKASEAKRSEPPSADEVRGRPGRRTAEEREQAVLEVLSGKASVDQVARRLGVLAETVEKWRQEALEALSGAMRRGDAKSERERELERENDLLKSSLIRTQMKVELMERALSTRPSEPKKSGK